MPRGDSGQSAVHVERPVRCQGFTRYQVECGYEAFDEPVAIWPDEPNIAVWSCPRCGQHQRTEC